LRRIETNPISSAVRIRTSEGEGPLGLCHLSRGTGPRLRRGVLCLQPAATPFAYGWSFQRSGRPSNTA